MRGGEGLCQGGGGGRDGVAVLVGTVAVVGDTVSVWPGTVSVRPGTVTEGGSRRGYRGHAETPSVCLHIVKTNRYCLRSDITSRL